MSDAELLEWLDLLTRFDREEKQMHTAALRRVVDEGAQLETVLAEVEVAIKAHRPQA